MYLETRDVDEMVNIYSEAWKKGVKTTYYLHMKPRHTAEQSTVKVNKSETVGGDGSSTRRKGFGAASSGSAAPASTEAETVGASAPKRGFGFGGASKAAE